jgi:hypothetical protein
VNVDLDSELGVSLVHTTFSVADRTLEQHTFEIMFDLATTGAAEEAASLMGR